MLALAGFAGLLSVLVGWIVTARLFALARETRRAPERLLAISFGGLYCAGYPLSAASRLPALVLTNEGSLLYALGAIGMVIGTTALASFPRVVFRPGARWAKGFSGILVASGLIGGIGSTVAIARARTTEEMILTNQPWALLLMVTLGACFAWNAVESFAYYRTLKRRGPLGLADPETAHRFLLWALASGGTLIPLGVIVALRASGQPILAPSPITLLSFCVLVTTGSWWLAFFMPRAYRERVLGPRRTSESASD